jgi:hypothetical protein
MKSWGETQTTEIYVVHFLAWSNFVTYKWEIHNKKIEIISFVIKFCSQLALTVIFSEDYLAIYVRGLLYFKFSGMDVISIVIKLWIILWNDTFVLSLLSMNKLVMNLYNIDENVVAILDDWLLLQLDHHAFQSWEYIKHIQTWTFFSAAFCLGLFVSSSLLSYVLNWPSCYT